MTVAGHSGDGRITQAMVDEMKSRLHQGRPGTPWNEYATKDNIRQFAFGMGDDNPLYLDEEYAKKTRWGTIIAPPQFPYSCSASSSNAGGMGFPGIFALHAYDEWIFHRPVRLGDHMRSVFTLVGLEEKPSKWGGRGFHTVVETRFTNQNDEVISVYNAMTVRAERTKAREQQKYNYEVYKYTDRELAQIQADYDAEERRGATPRYWEDVQVGDSVGHVVKGPLTVADMICWWMGAGAPYLNAFKLRWNRLRQRPGLAIIEPETNIRHVPEIAHYDHSYAVRSGVGWPYDIGRQRPSWFLHLATNWAGDDAWIKYIKSNFLLPNYVGDCTWCRGRVADKYVENGEHLVKLEMWADTQRNVRHAVATVTVQLTSQGDKK